MKLATIKDGSRDGCLYVVDNTLTFAVRATEIAPTLQAALDNWEDVELLLRSLSIKLNERTLDNMCVFKELPLMAPLPRAYQWANGNAYIAHMELIHKARESTLPEGFWTDPLMYQGRSDIMLSANAPIAVADEAYGVDFEAGVCVITDDVPMGITASEAASHIKLLMLVNDVSLRNLIPNELVKGFGFFHSKPATSFSPVAITPDELDIAWQRSKVNLSLYSYLNGNLFGNPNAGVDMTFSFADLVAHTAKNRFLGAGTIIGSGAVANEDASKGASCIAERRMREILERGEPQTSFMKFGDTIRIEMLNDEGQSLFGAIDQKVSHYRRD